MVLLVEQELLTNPSGAPEFTLVLERYLDVIFRSHQIKGIITFYKLGVLIRKV
jgi:hypothetical protein